MDELRDVSNIWTVLDSESGVRGQLRIAPIGLESAAGPLLAGVDSDQNRHLLVPLFPGEAFSADTTGKSVHLVRIRHERTDYASAVCLDHGLNDVFAQFAREFVDLVPTTDIPGRHLKNSLDRWRALFSDAPRGTMSIEEQVGLYGELVFVRRLLHFDPARVTTWWTGPDKLQHDFRWAGHALEVKASRAREGRRVKISSLEQLNAPAGVTLHLGYLRLEQDPGAESLFEIAESVAAMTLEPQVFRAQLKNAGYQDRDRNEYDELRMRVTETKVYNVLDPGFPRVVPTSFVGGAQPAGTEQFKYVIDLSNDSPAPMHVEAHDAFFAGLVGGR